MKWNKLGQIFFAENHSFAQSPQTIVFDDFVRIYYSTRVKDPVNGKYLSHIAFIDMNKNFDKIINQSTKPVIPLGDLGCFDEHGIFPINVVQQDNHIVAYTTGWNRRKSVQVDTAIGIAHSYDNGETFQKKWPGPVLSSSLNQPFLVADAFVKQINNVWHMWYIYGVRWTDDEVPERVYKIAYASSQDGVNWQADDRQIIANKLGDNECQALPTVIQRNKQAHMFFCYRHATDFRTNRDRGYKIGYASSDDLQNWTRDDEKGGLHELTGTGWDADMMCYPHVFEMDDAIYLLYNGNEFGKHGFGLAKLESIDGHTI